MNHADSDLLLRSRVVRGACINRMSRGFLETKQPSRGGRIFFSGGEVPLRAVGDPPGPVGPSAGPRGRAPTGAAERREQVRTVSARPPEALRHRPARYVDPQRPQTTSYCARQLRDATSGADFKALSQPALQGGEKFNLYAYDTTGRGLRPRDVWGGPTWQAPRREEVPRRPEARTATSQSPCAVPPRFNSPNPQVRVPSRQENKARCTSQLGYLFSGVYDD